MRITSIGAISFKTCWVVAWLLLTTEPGHCDSAEEQQEERWFEAELEVNDSGFPASFIDSLRQAKNVSYRAALRAIPSSLYLRREKLVLTASWGPVTAGWAMLCATPDSADLTTDFAIKAVTNRFVSAFFRVRDYICSTIDARGLYPVFFQEHIREGRYADRRWALYDQANRTVYSNRKGSGTVSIKLFSQDFMSVLYYIRSRSLTPGDTFSVPCYVHGKNYDVFFRCGKRKEIDTKAGTFDCISVEPTLVGEGRNFSKKDKLILWLTDDDRHMPVYVKSKIKVGSVVGELIHYE